MISSVSYNYVLNTQGHCITTTDCNDINVLSTFIFNYQLFELHTRCIFSSFSFPIPNHQISENELVIFTYLVCLRTTHHYMLQKEVRKNDVGN